VYNLISQKQETDEEKSYFAKALDKLREKEFDSIIELCTNELEFEAVGK
jgi:aspartate/glutamate racemase